MTEDVTWQLSGGVVLLLTGADAVTWLQGQTTQDVIRQEGWGETFFTLPTGQLLAHAYFRRVDQGVLIATQNPEVIEDRVRQFVIMEDVRLKLDSDQLWLCLTNAPDGIALGSKWLVPNLRAGRELTKEEVNRIEIELGIPRLGIDTNEKTLPPELGEAARRAISYTKGCYTGQEVLMRIYSRGHTNRSWVCLRSEEPLTPGTDVMVDGEKAGTTHRIAISQDYGHLATATLRNEHAADGTVVTVGGVKARVKNYPL